MEKRAVLVALCKLGIPVVKPVDNVFDIAHIRFEHVEISKDSLFLMTEQVSKGNCDTIDLSVLQGKKKMPIKGYWSNYMVHSNATGKFQSIKFDEEFEKNHLVEFVNDLHVGDEVHRFRDAQDCIGEFILKYKNMDEMFDVIKNIESKINVIVQ